MPHHYRSAALRVAAAALILFSSVSAAFVSASSLPTAGHTGQALALRAMLSPATKARVSADLAAARWPHFPNGRLKADPRAFGARLPKADANAQPILINEGTQTFDVFAPAPSFAPTAGPLTPTNLTPVWTADESYILFSSNRTAAGGVAADGNYHIWAVPAKGGPAIQITTGSASEFYPALNTTNTVLAFTSSANTTTGNQNLYIIGGQSGVPFAIGQPPVDPSSAAVANNPASALTLGDDNIFTAVTRPALSPAGDRAVFSAVTTSSAGGHTANVRHIYYLNVATRGYDPTQATPPAQLTDGPATDNDPAWSPKGDFIAFDSSSTGFTNTGSPLSATTSTTTSTTTAATRSLFLLNGGTTGGVGTVPTPLVNANGRVDIAGSIAGSDDFAPAWSANNSNQYTNPNADLEYLAFARGTASGAPHDIFYFLLTTNNTNQTITITPETATGSTNASVRVNTDDNPGETSPAGNALDDTYPAWSPFVSVFSIAYQSPRSVTYNTPQNVPLEVAVSLPPGTTTYGANNVGPGYVGILESQVLNLDPPTLLRFDGSEVVRVTDASGAEPSGRFIQPGQPVTFTVRLSNRETGINNTGDPNGGPNVYLQIKDPDSKYQDSQGIEHKIFARTNENPSPDTFGYFPTGESLAQGTNGFDYRHDSGSAAQRLFDGGAGVFAYGPGFGFGSYNVINNAKIFQFGAVGGTNGSDTIGVGHNSVAATATNPLSPANYVPWGPEYECQYVNPLVANPGTALGDYGTPYYLAGFDDQVAFSGSANPPRPITTAAATQTTPATFAEWLQLNPLPAAQQDGLGGVLYTATYTTPTASSDFFVDVVAYDRAVFPALTSTELSTQYLSHSKNWRIYDNVGGFTTTTFDGSNDILVVSDNALGQKFAATTFGGQNGNSNLQPTFYGAESYYTDVDEALLPNATDIQSMLTAPTAPAIPPQQNTSFPTNVTATPANGSVTVEWSGDNQPTYHVYRATVANGVFPTDYTLIGTVTFPAPATGVVATTFTDRNVTNGTTYYYVVTSVSSTGNESDPSQPPAQATPLAFGGIVHSVTNFAPSGGGIQFGFYNRLFTFPNVQNGLGVGSYIDGVNDDGGRVSVVSTDPVTGASVNANLPDGDTVVPNVRSQRYSLWRILSRGPVPSSVLAGYQPTFQAQPAVADVTNNVTAPAAPLVPVAQRCVIWVAPYSGDLPLVDSGSIENPTTQQTLTGYLQAGGRLCLSGANVASALSLKGTGNPATAGTGAAFLSTYLGAKFASQAGGGQVLGSAGTRLSGFSGFNGSGTFNGNASDFFPRLNSDGTITLNLPPSQQGSLLLGNDLDTAGNWRTDASLSQLGPNIDVSLNSTQGGLVSGRLTVQALAQINTITPNTGVTQDMTTNGTAGLIYHEDFTDALGAGYGNRVVFGSFGLEGISIDYYETTIGMAHFYTPRNQRPSILHNIVSYLRTGTFTVHVTQASGQGLAGATVYLRPNGGTLPGPRQVFSASDPAGTNTSGNYTISGVEPGTYQVVAYKSGFTTTVANSPFTVEGDTTNSTGLVLAPVPPGRITGTVKDNAGNPVAGATVTFQSTDGQTTYTVTTATNGTYTVDPANVSSYTGTASKLPQFAPATAPVQGNPVVVPSGGTVEADFVLVAQPASVSGVVFNDLNGDGSLQTGEPGVVGATVSFIPQATGVTAPTPVTTTTGGAYTVTGLSPGTYTISVSASGFVTNASRFVTVQAGDVLTGQNIPLLATPPVLPGTLGGLVADAYTGAPITGATVTIADSTGRQVTGSPFTTGASSSPAAPAGDGQPLNYGPVSLPPGSYTVTVSKAGFGTQSVTNQVVVSSAFTRVDFTSASGLPLQSIHVFPAGFNFFSVPYDYAAAGVGIDTIFGTLNTGTRAAPSAGSNRSHLFVWSPVLLQYLLDPTPPADGLHLGQGYWVYLLNASEVTTVGNLPSTATVSVGLHRGWNQIGVPSLTSISVARLSFANGAGGGDISFAQATTATYHVVSGTLYGYNGTGYVAITGTGALQPWQSYWIYAFSDSTILIPTGGG